MARRDQAGISALQFLPAASTLPALREAAQLCRGCPLFKNATQTVFGKGRRSARLFIVGEQPGHEEDLTGEPFVGPAGRILNQGLEAAGIVRNDAYVTNAVKHFKWEPRGERRLHKKPTIREVAACAPWLEQELEVVKPEVLLCLGSTASQALLRPDFKVTVERGKVLETALAHHALATIHPSSILRLPTGADREREMERFTADLRIVAGLLA